jgi:hypothetical protein
MTTNQPGSLAEIKERIGESFNERFTIENSGWRETGMTSDRILNNFITPATIKSFLLSTIDQSYELGRSVGRAELLSEIKGIIAESKGDEMIVLAGLLNKLTLK